MRIDAELFDICTKFIKDNQITCAEAVYDRDEMYVKSLELIEEICDLLGYWEDEDEDDLDFEDD